MLAQWNLGLRNSQPGGYLRSHLQLSRIVSLYLRRALLIRDDRHGHGGKSITYTNADGDTYAHIYTDASPISYPNSHAYANGHSYGNRHTYANGHGNRHTHANGHSYGNRHAYADVLTDGYSYADAVHGKMFTDTKAASDSGAAFRGSGDSRHPHSRSYTERNAGGSYGCRS